VSSACARPRSTQSTNTPTGAMTMITPMMMPTSAPLDNPLVLLFTALVDNTLSCETDMPTTTADGTTDRLPTNVETCSVSGVTAGVLVVSNVVRSVRVAGGNGTFAIGVGGFGVGPARVGGIGVGALVVTDAGGCCDGVGDGGDGCAVTCTVETATLDGDEYGVGAPVTAGGEGDGCVDCTGTGVGSCVDAGCSVGTGVVAATTGEGGVGEDETVAVAVVVDIVVE
jgi:hypothetical protein